MHFLDIVKFTQKLTRVIQNTFENCGYKSIIADVRDFCHTDEKRCHVPQLLTNWWQRPVIIGAQSVRILVDLLRVSWFAIKRESRPLSSEDTSDKLYDIGDDMGSILRYVVDYKRDEEITIGEFD